MNPPETKQRLVLCMDGTWNDADDSTHILHQFNLVFEGQHNGMLQKKKYVPGVGTGVLDQITGGGFGFGLEKNVREGYNWLVENYHDGDEIYVFGFSRGAYTARSLVGFISRCGLLKRGAPLTVAELWKQYAELGMQREERKSWASILPGTPTQIRQITDLVWDPWLIKGPDSLPGEVPGQRVRELNQTEKLLVRWSRRVKITYLGVYDTVGALGWDALAIPGLMSKLAMHHNLRPSSIIQKCRHAVALNEHRSSFNHTPFTAFVGLDEREDALSWTSRIEQRWFVGAHSNIGGGYESNRLAEASLLWMMQGAVDLVCEPLPQKKIEDPLPIPRDSFAEFARPLWTMIIRAKRNYRLIDPDPERRANRNAQKFAGFSLASINEQIDPSVKAFYATHDPPPNLIAYAVRGKDPELAGIAKKAPRHPWLDTSVPEYFGLIVWATLAAEGLYGIYQLVHLPSASVWPLVLAAAAFALIDWGESKANFSFALGVVGARKRAFLDSIYWTRTLGTALFVFGAYAAVIQLWAIEWADFPASAKPFAAAAAAAAMIAWIASAIEHSLRQRWKPLTIALVAGPLLLTAVAAAVVIVAHSVDVVVPGSRKFVKDLQTSQLTESAAAAGYLLLLQFALFYFAQAFKWAGDPTRRANLPSIVGLQFQGTRKKVTDYFEKLRRMLESKAGSEDTHRGPAAVALHHLLREALWRDIIGFVPVYALFLSYGLWYAANLLGWSFLQSRVLGLPLWALLPLVAALADYIEDYSHLRYIQLHQLGSEPGRAAVFIACSATSVKFAAFFTCLVLSLTGIFSGVVRLATHAGDSGWRGSAALLAPFALVVVVAFAVIAIFLRWIAAPPAPTTR